VDLRDIEWDSVDWIDLAHNSDQWRVLVNTVLNLRVPQNAGKFLSSCTMAALKKGSQFMKE
jgi:hypothetical protein